MVSAKFSEHWLSCGKRCKKVVNVFLQLHNDFPMFFYSNLNPFSTDAFCQVYFTLANSYAEKDFECHHGSFKNQINAYYRHRSALQTPFSASDKYVNIHWNIRL